MPESDKKDAVVDPLGALKKRLKRYWVFTGLGILVGLTLLGASVAIVVYSGMKSMSAFNELPLYRINALAVQYRTELKLIEQSKAETEEKIEGTSGQTTLSHASLLPRQIMDRERAFERLLGLYAQLMATASEQVGGALEWNRYFQADIQTLRDRSLQRQTTLQTYWDKFPVSTMAENNNDREAESPEQPASASAPTP